MTTITTQDLTVISLPAEARLWLFVSAKPLSLHTFYIQTALDGFVANWQSHGQPVLAAWDMVDDHIIRVAAHITGDQISGCSTDGLIRTLQALETQTGLALFDRLSVPVRFPGGKLGFAPYQQARLGISAADGASYWLDTTITTLEGWAQAWQRIG